MSLEVEKMELIINPSRVKKIKYQFVFYITLISFLMSIVDVYSTSLLFTLPFFYVCFMCGYPALLSYFIDRRFIMWDAILDSLIDTVKLIPFLLITYIIMEFIEHKTSHKTKDAIKKSGHFAPLIGGILGVVPQCGFSAAASSLYSARIITLGTLIAVFLSTSDEMLPILISEAVDVRIILSILGIKLVIAVIVGFIIDLFFRKKFETSEDEPEIKDLCKHEHCHCEHGIFKSALKHTFLICTF